ncbi:MAG: DUF2207 domain-containing protein [Actinomycetota bacterium]
MLPLSVAGRRLLLLALVVTTALLVAAPAAHAKSYSLPRANLAVRVNTDGTVDVAEEITFDFDGEFHGAWRDIPFRFGERIPLESISVGEGDRSYGSGGDTRLGTAGPSNTFASAHDAGGVRIVWRYDAADQQRTFRVAYRFVGLVRAFDDVAELNLRVWGDQWPTSLGALHADVSLPRGIEAGEEERLRVWGHPASVPGTTARTASGATLDAGGIPEKRWVEMRVLFPRAMLASTEGAGIAEGPGLDRIVDEEQAADRAARRRPSGRRSSMPGSGAIFPGSWRENSRPPSSPRSASSPSSPAATAPIPPSPRSSTTCTSLHPTTRRRSWPGLSRKERRPGPTRSSPPSST